MRYIQSDGSINKHAEINGWLQGSVGGQYGIFPQDNVTTVSKKDLARKGSFQDNRSRHSSERSDSDLSGPTSSSAAGKYSMLEFSLVYFRENLLRYNNNNKTDSGVQNTARLIEGLKIDGGKRKKSVKTNNKEVEKINRQESWSWREQADMIKWTKNAIPDSLLNLPSEAMNRAAVDSFASIMCIMGDLKFDESVSTQVDCIFRILKACHQWLELRDEVFCQLTKQTTNNKSPVSDSCLKGWRLYALICSWFAPSDLLKPYIINYLQQNASDPARPHHVQASTCLQLLRKTMKYGGRRNVPSADEIGAIMDGKLNKRHSVVLPGGVPYIINISLNTVGIDVISEICSRLGVVSSTEQDEFTLFTLVEPGNEFARLKREEYIMDIITEMKLHNKECVFMLERTSWYNPIRLELIKPELLDMIYNQLIPDYVDGYILSLDLDNRVPAKQLDDIVTIAALMYRLAETEKYPQSMKEIETMFPGPIFSLGLLKPSQLFNGVLLKLGSFKNITEMECKMTIIDMIRKWPLFGASFFNINCATEPRLPEDCMMAINRAGIHFLIPKTHRVILSYPFTEVISSRNLSADDRIEQSLLDIKVGNSKVQKVLRIGTSQGVDISYLISQYIKAINSGPRFSP